MAKRNKMAIEYQWPKKVEIKRFQDRLYKMLSEKPYLIDMYQFMTPLHSPDACILYLKMGYSSLIKHIVQAKLDVIVAPDTENSVKVLIKWPVG